MKPQPTCNLPTTSPKHSTFCHDPIKFSTYKHSIQWNLDSPTQPLKKQISHVKEDKEETLERPKEKKVEKKVMNYISTTKQISKKSKCEKDFQRDEYDQGVDDLEISQKQYIKKENKRLSQYLRRILRENKQMNHEVMPLTELSPLDIDSLVRENSELKANINSLANIVNEIREKIQVVDKIDIIFESLGMNTNETHSENGQHPTLKQKLQIIISSKNQNVSAANTNQQKLTIKDSQDFHEIVEKLEASEKSNKNLQVKCQDLDQENEELYQRIKSLDRLCIMKGEKYEENIENLMKSYENKIRQMTAIISVAQYDQQVNFIKNQNKRLSLLLEEKGQAILKMKEKMINKLDKIEQLQLENAELYGQLREALQTIDGQKHELIIYQTASEALKDQKSENQRFRHQIDQLEESLQKKTNEVLKFSLDFVSIKEEIFALEKHIGLLEKNNCELRSNLGRKINRNKFLQDHVTHLNQEFLKLNQHLPKIRVERERMLDQINKYKIENQELKLEIRRLSKTQLIKCEFDS